MVEGVNFLVHPESSYKRDVSYLRNFGCVRPERYIEIHTSGDVSICCFTWLPKFCGNFLTDSFDEILNNATRMNIISDMREGKFIHCNDNCPLLGNILSGGEPDNVLIVPLKDLASTLKSTPYVIGFSYDTSCNLQCPSCRPEFQYTRLNENKTLAKIHDGVRELVYQLLDRGEQVILQISGTSDPFVSPTLWNYMVELSERDVGTNLKIELLTNGLLMNEDNWNKIKPLWKNIWRVLVSTDAVSQETYSIVRKNGHIDKLKDNLSLFDHMVKNKDFPNLYGWQTTFTVQKLNYKELHEYVEWQLTLTSLNNIFFSMIAQWGHLTDEKFAAMSLDEGDKDILRNILKSDIFSNDRVMLGNLSAYR